jgi:hypothetical protein
MDTRAMHAVSAARLPQQHYRPPAVRIQDAKPLTPPPALAMYAGSVRPPPALAPRGRGQQPLTARCSVLALAPVARARCEAATS